MPKSHGRDVVPKFLSVRLSKHILYLELLVGDQYAVGMLVFRRQFVFVVEELAKLGSEGDDFFVPGNVRHRQSGRHRLSAVRHA